MKLLRNLTAILVAACCMHFAASLASAQQNAPVPIVVVDLSKVFEQHPTFKSEMERIKTEVKTTEASFQATGEKLKQQVQRLQTLKPSSDEFTVLETEISFKQGRIQADMALKRKEFLEREAQVYYSTYMQVQKVVATFAESNRIGMVLRYSSEKMDPNNRQSVMAGVNQPIVYNQSNLDITRFIVEQLHRAQGGQQTARGNNGQAPR